MATTLVLPLSVASYAAVSAYCLCGGIMEHAAVFRGWIQVHEPRQLKALQLCIEKTGDLAIGRRLNTTTRVRTSAIVFHGFSVLWILTRSEF